MNGAIVSVPVPNLRRTMPNSLTSLCPNHSRLQRRWTDERTREIIERDLPKWKKIFAENSLPQPLEMALRDYRLARYRDADEIQHTKFASAALSARLGA